MLKHTSNNNIVELQDLLDSDDELPTNYNEDPDLPAYLDDQRFDAIQFNWIKNNKTRSIPVKPPVTPVKPSVAPVNAVTPVTTLATPASIRQPSNTHQQENLPLPSKDRSNKNLIKKGILNEEDIFCMKSVAAQTTDEEALLWFIDFLMHKDLQADYRFLKSCLVHQGNYGRPKTHYSQIYSPKGLKNCFELVVK
ncbi:uncharacterized protein LOC133534184 [Cydia pomonella]|uniref:uncharacterized protein LOC133534184 n=1 Tax=Cydia pomonella TaxID=82600 RepID=UPI002ADDDC87|nr:uncharacterized protein LOC133534184 [Cydia pomonella]